MKEMMKKVKERREGFTMAELLIVVAIVAILVAISIPVFNSQLEKSREATDMANVRAAKAAATAAYLGEDAALMTDGKYNTSTNLKYDAANGKLVASTTSVAAYGKGTAAGTDTTDHTAQVVQVTISATGDIQTAWIDAA